ncbi:pimeloyl-ACP methyl ester carboxylesterase [Mucilaginibacter sp. UYNi724]
MSTAKVNNIDLCYDITGEQNTNNLILISGLGTQMIRWTIPFCEQLAKKGFRVIRFDNRDSGRSTFLSNEKVPDLNEVHELFRSGQEISAPYTLFDMVEDVVGLIDFLSISKAHFVGRSMGGIIGQLIVSQYPERVLSLTSIMSTSMNPALPPTRADVMEMMITPKPNPAYDKVGYLNQSLAFARRISGSKFSVNEKDQIEMIEEEIIRSDNQSGGLWRQLLAIMVTGYKKERLEKIKAPTLVIHGAEDPIFLPECGEDTANSIKGAEFMLIEGMGHEIPPALYAPIADAIVFNSKRFL